MAPHEAESVVIGMGERYDAIITAGDGVFAVIAEALGKVDQAVAILSTGAGSPPGRHRSPADPHPHDRRRSDGSG